MKHELSGALLAAFWVTTACVAPIATRSTPDHTTHVEVENATEGDFGISVAMVTGGAGQVSYDGRLRPGEIESLYVRNGADYLFSVTDNSTGDILAQREYPVWAYTNLVYDGVELVVSDRTVQVPPSERTRQANAGTFEDMGGGATSIFPLYVGAINFSGFTVAPGSSEGSGRLVVDETVHVVTGFSGETRMFSDYLALNGNIGYSPSENFHTFFIAFGPMIKFRPHDLVDPYAFFDVGISGFSPKGGMTFEDGQEVKLRVFGNLVFDFGGGLLLGATDNFTVDLQARFHRIDLEPLFMTDTRDFRKEDMFTEDSAIVPELRIGIRYARF